MERKQDIENSGFMPQKSNPLHETVIYKIGGAIFEVSTICGGSELLYDKMERPIKAESSKTPTDKKEKVRAIKKAQGMAGEHLTKPPYGYKVDTNDKKRWYRFVKHVGR